VPEGLPLLVRLHSPAPGAVGHRGAGVAARFCRRRGKLSSCSGEARGVGCFFLGAVFLFIFLVIMIYQPSMRPLG
jgi:hypothetical protein